LVANNAASYALQMVAGQSGLMYLLPLVPLAIIGAIGSPRRELVTLLAVIGALDLTVSTLTWSTYDGWRFLLVFAFTWIPWIIAESWEALTELARGSGRRWRSVPAFVIAVVVGVWGLRDLAAAFVAFREHQHDRPLVWYDELWDSPDVRAMKPRLPTQGAVIASNEPWLANRLTGRPAALVPYDLNPEEWMPFLQRIGATHVFLHGGDWPQPYDSNRQSLLASLAASGWRRVAEQGQLQLWMSDAFESSK
jgi:hypothetical protein